MTTMIPPRVRNKDDGKTVYTKTYESWRSMKKRCYWPGSKDWDNYGGRGITVCAQWQSYEGFAADMGERPTGMTLDRIDTDGNYEPANCRWADAVTQASNKRKKA